MDSAVSRGMKALNPFHPVQGEVARGLMTSLIVAMILAYFEALCKKAGVPDDSVVLFLDMIIGALLGFMLDIAFGTARGFCSIATGSTYKSCVNAGVQQLTDPISLMLGEVGGISFLKFIITVLVDVMVTLPLFGMSIKAGMDTAAEKKITKVFIATVTFFLYANQTRFSFAYKETSDQTDFIMTVFLTCVSMAFLAFPEDKNLSTVFSPKARFYMVSVAFLLMCVYFAVKKIKSGTLYDMFHGNSRRSAFTGLMVIALLGAVTIWGMVKSSGPEHVEVDTSFEMSAMLMALASALFAAGFVFAIRRK
jgi:hypothetical protein